MFQYRLGWKQRSVICAAVVVCVCVRERSDNGAALLCDPQ